MFRQWVPPAEIAAKIEIYRADADRAVASGSIKRITAAETALCDMIAITTREIRGKYRSRQSSVSRAESNEGGNCYVSAHVSSTMIELAGRESIIALDAEKHAWSYSLGQLKFSIDTERTSNYGATLAALPRGVYALFNQAREECGDQWALYMTYPAGASSPIIRQFATAGEANMVAPKSGIDKERTRLYMPGQYGRKVLFAHVLQLAGIQSADLGPTFVPRLPFDAEKAPTSPRYALA